VLPMINLPGIGGSGESHWQTFWERKDRKITRFAPNDWDRPELDDWIAALDVAISQVDPLPILVGHSLSCLLVAHWAARPRQPVAGAFLVCVPDPQGPEFPKEAASFAAVSDAPLPFPTVIVASSNDPYGSVEWAAHMADRWDTGLIVAGSLGHINAASGLGEWDEGRKLLKAFCAGTRRRCGKD
jgi:uncharacterized protein